MKDMIKQYEEDMSVLREIRKKYEIDFLYLKNNEEGMKSKVQNQDQELKFMRKKANG